jgi:hypothetical protein
MTMHHRIFVPLRSDSTKLGEADATPTGEGCFRLARGKPNEEHLLYKPGEIVECSIQVLPNGKKGLVATRSVSADPEFRSRRTVFAVCGAIMGAVFGALFALLFDVSSSSALIGAAVGAPTFTFCSIRWGDAAWDVLSRMVRWMSP